MTEPTDAARESLDHLQVAAHELLRAARSMLDAAEAVVNEPKALESIGEAFATVVRVAGASAAAWGGDRFGGGSDDDGESGVQHIRVS